MVAEVVLRQELDQVPWLQPGRLHQAGISPTVVGSVQPQKQIALGHQVRFTLNVIHFCRARWFGFESLGVPGEVSMHSVSCFESGAILKGNDTNPPKYMHQNSKALQTFKTTQKRVFAIHATHHKKSNH